MKCKEISEKMKHYNAINMESMHDLPHIHEDPEPGSRRCEGLRDLRCLEYQRANRSWPSVYPLNMEAMPDDFS